MHGEVAHPELGGMGRSQLDGVGNVVELEIEEYLGACCAKPLHSIRPVLDEERQPNFHNADVRSDLSDQALASIQREVERQSEALSCRPGRWARRRHGVD